MSWRIVGPMNAKVAQAKAELERLAAQEREIAERMAALQTYLLMDSELERSIRSTEPDPAPAIKTAATAKAAIIAATSELLAQGRPLHTREILAAHEEKGVKVGGKDKVQTLSAILSQDSRFAANRKEGWSLNEAPSPVGTGDGFDD